MNLAFEQVKPETLAVIEANAKRFGLSVDHYLQSILPKDEQNLDDKEAFIGKTHQKQIKVFI